MEPAATTIGDRLLARPLAFRPHLEERVWGGRRLEALGKELPPDKPIGESWEISAIPGRSTAVDGGPLAGRTLADLLAEDAGAILGSAGAAGAFPLLIKLLDAAQPLSVQLHPNDGEAVALEGPGPGSVGKTEAWIILDAVPGAEIIHGLARGVDAAILCDRLQALEGRPLPAQEERALFRWIPVRRGDIVFVPAGTIHALGPGILLAEVQQSSDLTYRIYDWGRLDANGRGRELHFEKSRRVRLPGDVACPWTSIDRAPRGDLVHPLLECAQFSLELIRLRGRERLVSSTAWERSCGFQVLIGWEGQLRCSSAGGTVDIAPARSVLLPACTGGYELESTVAEGSCIRVHGPAPQRPAADGEDASKRRS